jgi:hypothetical protein
LEWALKDREATINEVVELDLPWYSRPSISASQSLIRSDLIFIGKLHRDA